MFYNYDNTAIRIIKALDDQKPFSLVRVGDGEGRILMYPGDISRHMLDRHLRFWFGHADFTDNDLAQIRLDLIKSISHANLVGHNTKLRNRFWNYATDYVKSLDENGEINRCDINVHSQMWKHGLIDKVVSKADRVALITCRDIVDDFEGRYPHLKNTKWISIPEEANTGHTPTNHYPDRFYEVLNEVTSPTQHFTLYLIGAGVLGKTYCRWAKNSGHVAVDIGSLFDGWAGVKSRSYYHSADMNEYSLVEHGKNKVR